MSIDDLIQRLTDYRDELGGDAEVRLMTQQNWPFENSISGVTSGHEINDGGDEDRPAEVDDENVVFIVETHSRNYDIG